MDFAQDQAFVADIRRHFVGLAGVWVELDPSGGWKGEERPYCYSGFVVDICGCWCFMTAGHVFEEIDRGLSRGQIKLLKCGLADYFSVEAKVKDLVPFVYEDVQRIAADAAGMDVGFVPLRDHYRMHLEANGVTPVRVARWEGHTPPPFDGYCLLGLPEEQLVPVSREGERGPQIGYRVTLSLVSVEALEQPPPDRIVSRIPRFCGLLQDGGGVGSVRGLSGGPIFGVSRAGGGWEYACVAVQGSWDPGRRMIYGTPLAPVVEAVTRLLRRTRPQIVVESVPGYVK